MAWLGILNYWIFVLLLMTGMYAIVAKGNLIKKLIGLGICQSAVFLLFISMGKVVGGTAPILDGSDRAYSSPLPQVLILTAIVVGISTMALALAVVVRIRESFGSIEEADVYGKEAEA
ncbi:cation:proton antiporter subunit C [Pseudokordiimonas caeni]|uniref:cation:proton antiporter subunit C n=1 Tax=Pseudokordiimonas caeni TaxID=2997908 RepID=UPI002811CED4|nr:cation:proton antiporter subunit C [Pseudokordiimonas caeni]